MTHRTNSIAALHDVIPDRCERPTRKLKDGTVVELPSLWLYCSDCGRRKKINPSCGKRNCRRCQFKRSRKLERKYLEAIIQKKNQPGQKWTFVNLTGVHVTVSKATLPSDLRKFGNAMQKFLSEEYEEAGLAVIEHTTRVRVVPLAEIYEAGELFTYSVQGPATIVSYEYALYVHGHALCYGGYKDKVTFEKRWASRLVESGFLNSEVVERNEGRRFVGLELVRNPKSAARYILKYVAKGVELTDEYVEVLKRLKYVRSWGFLYGKKEPTFDLICDFCGGKCYIAFDEGLIIENYGDKAEPLKVQRVLKEVAGPP